MRVGRPGEGSLLFSCLHDRDERIGFEAGPTNERPIDIRLMQQAVGVLGSYRAAIDDGSHFGNFIAVKQPQFGADKAMGFLSLVRSCDDSGPDGPNWLVSHGQPAELLVAQPGAGGEDLALEYSLL